MAPSQSHSTVIDADAVSEKPLVAGPFELELAALGRRREEGDERIGGDRRKQVGAKNLDAVEAAGEARDDVARNDFA